MSNIEEEFDSIYVNSDDIQLHVVYSGDNENKMMIFLHGFPECWYSWRYQLKYFSRNYLTVAPDLRGYNLSSKPESKDKYKIRYLLNDVKALINHFNKSSAVIIGHDWGGLIAWWMAMKYPQLVDKLIILNAPHPGVWLNNVKFMPKQLRKSWYIFFFQVEDTPEEYFRYNDFTNLKLTMQLTTYKKEVFDKEEMNKFVECWKKDNSLKYMINYYRANLKPTDFMSFSKKFSFPLIRCQTLIIWGVHDFALEKDLLIGTEKYVKKLDIVYIDDAGHWIQQEVPDKVNKEIKRFIEKS